MERARLGDDELARLAACGDDRAFEELYRRHERALLRYCRSITGDDEDASDALQSAMLGAVRALPSGTRDSGVRAWLYAIARNESITVLRRRRPVASEDAIDGSGASAPSADAVAADRERAAQVVLDLGQLSERQRDAIVLRELADVSYDEIAAMHGSTAHAVRQSVTEARTALREIAAGREASCATIRPALVDRRRRSRAVRAHLNSCRSCQALATSAPRHAFAPLAGVAYVFKRIAAWLGVEGSAQGLASSITSSGAGKPAAAAGLALVAALAAPGGAEQHRAEPTAEAPAHHAKAHKKAAKTSAPKTVAKISAPPGTVEPKAATVKTIATNTTAKSTVHTDAAVEPRSSKPVARQSDPVDDQPVDRHDDDPPAGDRQPVADHSDPPPQHPGGGDRGGRGDGSVAAAGADCPQGQRGADGASARPAPPGGGTSVLIH